MAQAEGGSLSDYPKIARVIINRLHDGMRLQFDSVLLYGLHAYAINVTEKQINTPGPYNDFMHAGLPPTPISNPGKAAIEAILHPAPGPWLYFLTNSGGKSTFSATPLAGPVKAGSEARSWANPSPIRCPRPCTPPPTRRSASTTGPTRPSSATSTHCGPSSNHAARTGRDCR